MNSKALVSGADVACRLRGKKENYVDQNSQQISHIGTANIQKSADSTKNNVVQNTIRVKDKGLCYTVNLYNTTSRLLLNGKNVEIFLNRDVKQIHDMIQKMTSAESNFNIDKLNQSLAIQLETLLTNKGSVNHENRDCEETGTATYSREINPKKS